MHKIVNPQQTRLFDSFDSVLTEKTRKRLLDGWPGVFRHVILELMPVDAVSGYFDPIMGRPTKELYSTAGLIFIMEFMDWTKDEALDAYSFNMNIQYALNLEPIAHDISERTLERYINLFKEDDLAKATMDKITVKLVDHLGIKIDKQRLDSTHIFSDMASFGRTRLMGVVIKRFLTQVIRSSKNDYNSLEESFRNRYTPGVNRLFADTKKDSQSRRLLRQQVAEDMHFIIRHFGSDSKYNGKDTYKLNVPKYVPAKDFWSVIVYSMKTKGFVQNAERVGLSSRNTDTMKMNEDGSYDIYFAPKAPEGKENNWIPTGEDFFLLFRLYGPESKDFFKTWMLGDLVKVK